MMFGRTISVAFCAFSLVAAGSGEALSQECETVDQANDLIESGVAFCNRDVFDQAHYQSFTAGAADLCRIELRIGTFAPTELSNGMPLAVRIRAGAVDGPIEGIALAYFPPTATTWLPFEFYPPGSSPTLQVGSTYVIELLCIGPMAWEFTSDVYPGGAALDVNGDPLELGGNPADYNFRTISPGATPVVPASLGRLKAQYR